MADTTSLESTLLQKATGITGPRDDINDHSQWKYGMLPPPSAVVGDAGPNIPWSKLDSLGKQYLASLVNSQVHNMLERHNLPSTLSDAVSYPYLNALRSGLRAPLEPWPGHPTPFAK